METDLAARLSQTVALLQRFRRKSKEQDVERFAEAEVKEADPFRSRHLHHQDAWQEP